MQFMVLLYSNESAWAKLTPDQLKQSMAAFAQYNKDLAAAGVLKQGEWLKPTHDARTVRLKQGQVVTTDGPFVESKEQLGGYYVLETKDEAEAVAWAGKCPLLFGGGTAEVREVLPRA